MTLRFQSIPEGRPGTQAGLVRTTSARPRAADGDRPRSVGERTVRFAAWRPVEHAGFFRPPRPAHALRTGDRPRSVGARAVPVGCRSPGPNAAVSISKILDADSQC